MNGTELERFRIALLQVLGEVAPAELPVATLVTGAKIAGFRDADPRTVQTELAYLTDKGLVAQADKALSPENTEWRIAAAGRDYLATRGL